MGKTNLQIFVTPYQYADTVAKEDCNLFSSAVPTQTVSSPVNIFEYVVNMDSLLLSQSIENADLTPAGINELFFLSSEISLTLTDLKLYNGSLLSDFFYLYEDKTRRRYYFEIYLGGVMIWQGIMNNESLQKSFVPKSDKYKTFTFQIRGLEKEFAEYYSSKTILDPNEIKTFATQPISQVKIFQDNLVQDVSMKQVRLDSLFSQLFSASSFFPYSIDMTTVQGNGIWRVNLIPFLTKDNTYSSVNTNYIFIKNGYQRLYDEKINRFELLSKICASMGWVFNFTISSGQRILKIKQRQDSALTTYNISYNDLEFFNISSLPETIKYDYIEIPNGYLAGGDTAVSPGNNENLDFRGDYVTIITDKASMPYNTDFFYSIAVSSSTTGGGQATATLNSIINNNNGINFTYRAYGTAGNGFRFIFIDTYLAGQNPSLNYSVTERLVTVRFENNVTTANSIINLINNNPFVNALIIASNTTASNGTGAVRLASNYFEISLSGGYENTVVTYSLQNNIFPLYKFTKYQAGGDEINYKVGVYQKTSPTDYTQTSYSIPKDINLKINSGQNGTKFMKFQTIGAIHHYQENNSAIDDSDLVFKGNYGDMLFYFQGSNKYFTYNDYIKTDTFVNNFRPLLNTSAKYEVIASVKETLTDPNIRINVTDYNAKPFNSGEYSVQSMTTDLINDKTELTLYKL